MNVMFSKQGLGMWNKLWILNLAHTSVYAIFSFWEICWEWGGVKARKEDVLLAEKSQGLEEDTTTPASCDWAAIDPRYSSAITASERVWMGWWGWRGVFSDSGG